MQRAFLFISLLVFSLLILWVALASQGRFLTNALKPESRLFALHQCAPMPCWHDIRPGATSFVDAAQTLRDDGLFNVEIVSDTQFYWYAGGTRPVQGYVYAGEDGIVSRMVIIPRDPGLPLERMIARYGEPERTQCECRDASGLSFAIYVITLPGNAVVAIQHAQRCGTTAIEPELTVTTFILYQSPPPVDPLYGTARPWRGYGSVGCPRRRV